MMNSKFEKTLMMPGTHIHLRGGCNRLEFKVFVLVIPSVKYILGIPHKRTSSLPMFYGVNYLILFTCTRNPGNQLQES